MARRRWRRRPNGGRASGRTPTLCLVAAGTLRAWLAAHPPPDASFTQTLALVSERVRAGEDLRFAVREFLDELALLPREDLRIRAIRARPEPTGDPRADAYLGALAEHVAATHGMERPAWSVESERFLERFWFVSEVPGFRALAVAQSPAAFRRRGIFIAKGALQRV
jgi:hypothetical protein